MKIDQNAPLHARKDILIHAPIEQVWALHTNLQRWPDWQPDVATISVEGDVVGGTIFRWKAAGLNITSTLQVVDPPRQIGWTGVSLGMKAIHLWTFTPEGDGTRVTTEESLSGWMPTLIRLFSPRFLEQSLEKSLQTLKNAVERTPGSPAA